MLSLRRSAGVALLCFPLISPGYLTAEEIPLREEIVVSATRVEALASEVGSSILSLSSEAIEATRETRVLEVLKKIPGLDVVQSGGAGGNTAIFMRGANSEHTLVLVDGVEMNNPVSTNRSFNFADLSLDNIERIEVLRGPQSTLYGSDALGGVISIVTKRGAGPTQGTVSLEAGSYASFLEKASLSGATGAINYSMGVSREDTGGVSAARSSMGNSEADGYRNSAISARVGFSPMPELSANLFVRYNDGRSEIDNVGGFGGDDPNRIVRNEQLALRGEVVASLWDGRLRQTYGASLTDHNLNDDNDPDTQNPFDFLRSKYEGRLLKFDLQNVVEISDSNVLLVGVETEEERASSEYRSLSVFGPFDSLVPEESARTQGYYIQDQISVGKELFVTVGGRVDDHSGFGTRSTWRVTPSYHFSGAGTRIFGSYGTGFKAPSLLQLYSQYGNRELSPEKSTGWDVGIEQEIFSGRMRGGVTYFRNAFDNLISFDSNTFIFENIEEAETQGVESSFEYRPSGEWGVSGAYTYTDTKDSAGLSLLRRPRHKLRVGADLSVGDGTELSVNYTVVGSRFDNDFSTFLAERKKLGGYGLVNVVLRHEISSSVELFARVENLFDKEYEEVIGFGTRGVGAYGGVKLTF